MNTTHSMESTDRKAAKHIFLTYPGVRQDIWKFDYDLDESITLEQVTLIDKGLMWYMGKVYEYTSVSNPACSARRLSTNFFALYFGENLARLTTYNKNYNLFVHAIVPSSIII
jgi:hypothetical protein